MAFRIAIDLGIHLPSDRLQSYVNTLTAEDIEVRKRLFWSCYTWDKAISLYLGRMPAFTPPMEAGVPIFSKSPLLPRSTNDTVRVLTVFKWMTSLRTIHGSHITGLGFNAKCMLETHMCPKGVIWSRASLHYASFPLS